MDKNLKDQISGVIINEFNRNRIINMNTSLSNQDLAVLKSVGEIDDVRNSKIKWIHHDENSEWLFNKLSDLSINANNQIWGFDIYSIIDSIQYTEYPEGG